MEPPNFVVMTVVVVRVEPVPLDNTAVEDLADVNQLVLAANAVMMAVEVSLVENARPPKLAPTGSVLEHQAVIAAHVPVVTTETEEVVDLVQLVKDAEVVIVNATTAVMKEIVVIVLNQKEPTKDYVLPDLVELAPPDLPAEPMEDVPLFFNALLLLLLLIVQLAEQLDLPVPSALV